MATIYRRPAGTPRQQTNPPQTGGGTITAGELLARARALQSGRSDAAARQINVGAHGQVLPIIYGRDTIGGMLAGWVVSGNVLYVRMLWCHGECEQIVGVTINGESDPNGVTRTDYLGTTTQGVDPWLQAAYAARGITYTDTLPGVCYSVLRASASALDAFPEAQADIKGRKVRSTAGGARAWSDCPAYCVADFREDAVFGMGGSINWADVATVAAANNATVGGVARRTINLSMLEQRYVEEWLDVLCEYAGAWKTDEGGVLRIAPRYLAGSPVMTFDTSNIEAGSLKLSKPGTRDIPTVILVSYTNTTLTPPGDDLVPVYAAGVEDGTTDWRETPLPLPGVNSAAQAYREGVEFLNAATLSDLKCQFDAFDIALKLQLGDPISVTHPIGLTAKAFWITDLVATGPGRYRISGTEYDAAIASNAVVSSPSTPDSGLPVAGTPPTLTGLSASEEIYRTGDGLISSRLRASWTDPAWPNTLHVLVEIRDGPTLVHSGTAWSASYVSPALQEGKTYTIAATLVSRAGVAGTAAQTDVAMVGKVGTLPGNVPSFSATEAGGKVYARWSAATDLDTLDYELRYGAVGVSWDSATYVQRIAALAYTIEGVPPGTWDFLVKARDSYKQYSATEAEQTVTVTLDSTAAQLGSKTFSSPTLVQMTAYTVAGLPYWTTDNAETWGYGYTGANWNSDSLGSNVWCVPTSSTGSSWTSEAWDLGTTTAATIVTNLAPTAHSGSAAVKIGYSTDGSTYAWITGASAKLVARYIKVRASIGSGNAMTIVGPITATATGVLRRESGSVTSSASTGALVQLAGLYAQAKSIQLTAQASAAMQPVYDRVLVYPETGLLLSWDMSASGSVFQYFSAGGRTLVAGDTLEFDVLAAPTNPDGSANMGIYVTYSDASNSGHYTTLANGTWISKSTALTAGKTINGLNLAAAPGAAGAYKMLVRNVRITNGGVTQVTYWSSGEPTQNSTVSSTNASNIQMGPANSFRAYCFDGGNAQVAKPLSYTFEGA